LELVVGEEEAVVVEQEQEEGVGLQEE